MTGFRSGRLAALSLCGALGAAVLSLGAAEAIAQGYGDNYSQFRRIDRQNATSSYGYQVAPGYDRPDFDVDPVEGEAITVFEEAPLSSEPDSLDRSVNEFAGENQKFNNGIWSFLDRFGN